MGSLSIWHWLIFLSIIGVPVVVILALRGRSGASRYQSLSVASPVLIAALLVASYAEPAVQFVSYMFFNGDKASGEMLRGLSSLVVVPSIVASFGISAAYYFKVISNINYFSKKSIASPSAMASLPFIPFVNVVGFPYLLHLAYYHTSLLNSRNSVSKYHSLGVAFLAMVLAIGAALVGGTGLFADSSSSGLSTTKVLAGVLSMTSGAIFSKVIRRVTSWQESHYKSENNRTPVTGPKSV